MQRISFSMKQAAGASWKKWAAGANLALCAAIAVYAADPVVISIPSKDLFPESVTSTSDGAIIIGSYGTSSVWRIPAGKNDAAKWFDSQGKGSLLGVLADEASGRLLVCQGNVKTFDLKSGASKGDLTIPTDNPFCNDLAVRANGDIYISDTRGAKIYHFPKGATTAVESAADPLLAGVDGLAFLANPNQLYANSVTTGKLLRLDLGADGKSTKITDLKLSRLLAGPDGMRPIDGRRILIAEGQGRIALAVPNGDTVEITTLKDGGMEGGTPAVTITKGVGWAIEGKIKQKGKVADGGPFRLFPVTIPN